MKGQFTFSKEERLTGKTSIDQLFNEGKSFNIYPFRAFYRMSANPEEPAARLLIAIPKKKIKLAVDRNRLRRRIREAYRLNKTVFITGLESLRAQVHVALVYTGDQADVPYRQVEMKITACLARLRSIIASESGK